MNIVADLFPKRIYSVSVEQTGCES